MFKKIFSLLVLTTALSTHGADNLLTHQTTSKDTLNNVHNIAKHGTPESFKNNIPVLTQYLTEQQLLMDKQKAFGIFFSRPDVSRTEKISILCTVAQHNPNFATGFPLITLYEFALMHYSLNQENLNAPDCIKKWELQIEKYRTQLKTETNENKINMLTTKRDALKDCVEQVRLMVVQNQQDLELLTPLIMQFPDHIKTKFTLSTIK